jgi:hypothetical protein
MLWTTIKIKEELRKLKLRVLLLGRLIYKFYKNKS